MSRNAAAIVIGLAAAASLSMYARVHGHPSVPRFQTAIVAAGDVVRRVAATGTVETLTTAQVGSQVSGTISQLGADFNSIVRKGQVLVRLDPSLIDADIQAARSAVAKASADAEGAKVAVGDAEVKLKQAATLHERQLIPDADFDAANVALDTAKTTLESARAQEAQARAVLDQALVNRQHTVIAAPIDGIVIARNVDVGQTVAASFQAPTLFVIAADLTRLQLNAGIDESDVGLVRVGQKATFTVDAYPQDQFVGIVRQVRLQPVITQNVVTYPTLIDVNNSDLRLKPGMTATLNIEVARSTGVLRVPAAALKFVPQRDEFAELGEPVPPEYQRATTRRAAATGPGAQGLVWVYEDGRLDARRVIQGLSDGAFVEVRGNGLREDLHVVTGEIVAPGRAMVATPLSPVPTMRR
jgi:HlyD family secretion protein